MHKQRHMLLTPWRALFYPTATLFLKQQNHNNPSTRLQSKERTRSNSSSRTRNRNHPNHLEEQPCQHPTQIQNLLDPSSSFCPPCQSSTSSHSRPILLAATMDFPLLLHPRHRHHRSPQSHLSKSYPGMQPWPWPVDCLCLMSSVSCPKPPSRISPPSRHHPVARLHHLQEPWLVTPTHPESFRHHIIGTLPGHPRPSRLLPVPLHQGVSLHRLSVQGSQDLLQVLHQHQRLDLRLAMEQNQDSVEQMEQAQQEAGIPLNPSSTPHRLLTAQDQARTPKLVNPMAQVALLMATQSSRPPHPLLRPMLILRGQHLHDRYRCVSLL